MVKKNWTLMIVVVILLVFSTSCNLPAKSSNPDKNATEASQINGNTTETLLPELVNTVEPTPDPKPVSFQDGLGSLDSYKMKIHVVRSESTGSSTTLDEFVESSVIDENNHSIMTSKSKTSDDPEESTSTSETYNLGTVTCSYSDGEWSYEKKTAQDKEINDVFSRMIDFVPVINNPVLVGAEEVNGVNTNHFTFKLSGIGEKSGAVAVVNQGDYWLATDGQYIVKYTLNLQIQSAPEGNSEAKISNLEASYDLYDINVPVVLTQPAECVATSN